MIKFRMDETSGTFIGQDSTLREVKLFTSPKSNISTQDFALGLTVIKPGQSHEVHKHDANSEVQVIYKGCGLMTSRGATFEIKEGDVIGLSTNEDHGFENTGDVDLEILWVYYPPGVADEKFFKG